MERFSKKGQVTIFIVVAVLLVAGVVLYFTLRGSFSSSLSKEMEPVYDYYLSCVEQSTEEGIGLLGEQGGYIYADEIEFVPGSQYRPFSSHLEFMGQGVPYWMYVSGNNLLKEQKPTKEKMEAELERYLEERIDFCDFEDFNLQGYDVFLDDKAEFDVVINENDVDVSWTNGFSAYFEEQSVVLNEHEFDIDSKLGKFFGYAEQVYAHEKEEMFLEDYALDVMRLYAPVDGSEITCEPKVFVDEKIRENLTEALAANIHAVKLDGDYYDLANKDNSYFIEDISLDVDADENVNFIYSQNFPTRIEIYGDKVVKPVGMQEGLGILGFCYVPYHLVYDINFPVLVQFYDSSGFIFQFPVSVLIEKSQARSSLPTEYGVNVAQEVCKYPNKEIEVFTYDSSLNPVESYLQFKCLGDVCSVGDTENVGGEAVFRGEVPRCVNGFILASADGYADKKYLISTNEEESASIILNKLYNISLDLGSVDEALVSFESDENIVSVMYPFSKSVELSEGYYNVSVYVYDNSSLVIPASSTRKCVTVPESGLGGFLGGEREECFDINLPETKVDRAIVGGGKAEEFIDEFRLKNSQELNIDVPLFGKPSSVDDLQTNAIKAEDETIYLEFE